MPTFSERSLERLATCHPDLRRLFFAVVTEIDCTVLCGHRCEADQRLAFEQGNSQLDWPLSMHNRLPSLAVDVGPYPLDWNDIEAFRKLAQIVKIKAQQMGIKVSWGGDWQTFKDYPHWELTGQWD